jgi:hypothetical protein
MGRGKPVLLGNEKTISFQRDIISFFERLLKSRGCNLIMKCFPLSMLLNGKVKVK